MSLKHQIARKEIMDTCLEALSSHLMIGTWGNVSVRIADEDLIAITPSGVDYEKIVSENIAILDLEGNRIDGNMKPSSEWMLHLEIYKRRPDVFAVVHTHSVHCTAMAIARKPIPAACEDLIQVAGGDVRVADFCLPGTADLGHITVEALEGRNAVLMANHGLVATGPSLKEAIKVALICEKSAQATLLAQCIGGAVPLSEADCRCMRDFYVNRYGQ